MEPNNFIVFKMTSIIENNLCLELNKKNNTADVTGVINAEGDVTIPRSVNYQSQDYIIDRVCEN